MNSQRRELLDAMKELGQLYPEWRFGQLVENAAAWAGEDEPLNVGEATDAALLQAIRRHLARHGSKATSTTR